MMAITEEGSCPAEIKVFTFTIMGVKIGVEAEQVAGIMEVKAAETLGMPVLRFDEIIPFGGGPAAYGAPKAIMIRGTGEPFVVIIDRPDDIALIGVRYIQPIPAVIAGTGSPPLLWGAVVEPEGILLLVDFSRGFREPPDRPQREL